ncbi:unnamed protein product [Trifolium pratense]|uniref:Uncharacterized protein n=1 Tax=Trifolium pratense TaxID=57577 RepID=A0ACB0LTA6_TRIPR|nr:unnamed protein product [Trifolium pratense]
MYLSYVFDCRFIMKVSGIIFFLMKPTTEPSSRLNGGPCCSSVGQGAFAEHGPFKPTRKDHLMKNQLARLILQTKSTKISLKRIPQTNLLR